MALQRLAFSEQIDAPSEKVWRILWDDASYRQWTSVFSEGSYAVSDWKEGSRVQFLTGDGSGMYSIIENKVPNRLMAFRHQGAIQNGVAQPVDALADWSGAMEIYSLQEKEGRTELKVEMDVTEGHAEYFKNSFPKALQQVKELSEQA